MKTSEPHDSCTETCARHQLECENRFFAHINTNKTFRASQLLCKHTQTVDPVKESRLPGFIIPSYLPAHDLSRDTCLLQSDSLLFSCASVSPGDVVRVCPCRGSWSFEKKWFFICWIHMVKTRTVELSRILPTSLISHRWKLLRQVKVIFESKIGENTLKKRVKIVEACVILFCLILYFIVLCCWPFKKPLL